MYTFVTAIDETKQTLHIFRNSMYYSLAEADILP